MTRLLFICHGNICRSPMAEFVMQALIKQAGLSPSFQVASCATSREELGRDIHPGTRKKLLEMGIPFAPRKAVQLRSQDYSAWDHLIGMDRNNIRNAMKIFGSDPSHKLCLLLSFAGEQRDIADPWYTGNFDDTFADVMTGCKAVLAALSPKGSPP